VAADPELRSFVDHLGGGPPPRSSAAEGAAEVRTIARQCELAGEEAAVAQGARRGASKREPLQQLLMEQ
jgi:hypothetical protein